MNNKHVLAAAFVRAREALGGTDVTSLQLAQLQTAFNTLVTEFDALAVEFNTLQADHNDLKAKYNSHIHRYSDVDNTGTVLNKNTELAQ